MGDPHRKLIWLQRAYVDRLRAQWSPLEEHLKLAEWEAAGAKLHQIAGTAAMYGFDAIGDAAATLLRLIDRPRNAIFVDRAIVANAVDELRRQLAEAPAE